MSMETLSGKVVLIEVWESSCINCVRGLPVLNALQARYRDNGFVVLGIHSPEYNFTASRAVVERASRRFGLEFPVASDSHQSFWKSWSVRGWPTTYLLDAQCRLAFFHRGEFSSRMLERSVQALLCERHPQLRFPTTLSPQEEDSYAPGCGFVTPDISTTHGLDALLNPEGVGTGDTIIYADPGPVRSEGTFFLRGPWSWLLNGLQRGAAPGVASIGVTYTAKEVYAVVANTGETMLWVEIRQDGKPLSEANRGSDVVIARDGRSFLRLTESRLHYLVVNSDVGRHDLELSPDSPTFQIHSFNFANRCQTNFPHR